MDIKVNAMFVDNVLVLKQRNGIPTSIKLEGLGLGFHLPLTLKGTMQGKPINKDAFSASIQVKKVKDGQPTVIYIRVVDAYFAFTPQAAKAKIKEEEKEKKKRRNEKNRARKARRRKEQELRENSCAALTEEKAI